MQIVFLGARLPLTKTILQNDGVVTVASYPHVSRLTSYHCLAKDIVEFHAYLCAHAHQGHCLFNGQLQKPLVDESRAGKTLKDAPRDFVVFDFDKVEAKNHADVVRRFLPKDCHDVSYIVQYSASMFRPGNELFSGHIIMQLKQPSTQKQLREWFESINFSVATLKEQIKLADSGIALHWPLDRSAAYDSKLIYIAPPKCQGFEPAIKIDESIQLVSKKKPTLAIPAFTPVSKSDIEAYVSQLRQDLGMPARDFRTRKFEDGEVLIEAEAGMITDIKPSGEHYITFNLNGGDSRGYWIDLRNPAVIKNFKGEPWLQTTQVDEKFYKQIAKVAPSIVKRPPLEDGAEVLAFYATNQSSQIKIGTYKPIARELTLHNSNETASRSWLTEFGIIGAGRLPHMDLVFNPKSDIQYIPGATAINTFRITPFMAQAKSKSAPSQLREVPRTIDKTIRSILGTPDEALYAHFINWLAYIFQYRDKAQTAWVLSGRTGTGKNVFVNHILRPLFGNEVVHGEQFSAVMHQFNGYLEKSLFVVYEEADTRSVQNPQELMAKLKHYITDSPISIRRMNNDHYDAPNFCNFLFLTNERSSVLVPHDDRRFNFGERQEEAIQFTPNEVLGIADELEGFADMLQRWQVNVDQVRKVIDTKARDDVHEATTPINQLIAEAILCGNLQFFVDHMPSDAEAAADFPPPRTNPISMYKGVIDKFVTAVRADESIVLKDEDLFTLFRTLIPNPHYFQDSKVWRRRHYKSLGLDLDKYVRLPGNYKEKTRGIVIKWRRPLGIFEVDVTGKVTDIKKGKRARK